MVAGALSAPYNLQGLEFQMGPPSGPLLAKMSLPTASSPGSLASYGFVGSVGGVAFAHVAEPNKNCSPSSVSIDYDASVPDGSRLTVRLDNVRVQAFVPDWMMVPIAKYADSEYNACVSLFGPESTDTQYDIIYHPAFQDTLLGLRLLQADILLFDLSRTWDLPAQDGIKPLGLGEREPTQMNAAAVMSIQEALAEGTFQSWVLTDADAPTRFEVTDAELRFSGAPYYYFWIADIDGCERKRNELFRQAEAFRDDMARYKALVKAANALEPVVSPVSSMTEKLRVNVKSLSAHNPAVFNAALNTMRYAAFFRYVKEKNPDNWAEFLEKIRTVPPQPTLRTPTQWAKP